MKVTIRDIAKIAGVSHSTVSRSLNDSDLISAKTKEKIQKIADEMGFEFNNNARSLSTNKTGTIGVVFPEGFENDEIASFFASFAKTIRRYLEKYSYDIILEFPINYFTDENNIKKLIQKRKVDGLLIASSHMTHEEWEYVDESDIPVVFLHLKPEFENNKIDFVCTDHFKGGYLAGEHLVKNNHKDILTITFKKTDYQHNEFVQRTNGFKQALEDNNIKFSEENILRTDIVFEDAYELAKKNIDKIRNYTAIFAQTDLMALGTIKALNENGIKVPEDISIIGYDDLEFLEYLPTRLTTIHQPKEELSNYACERLINKINKSINDKVYHEFVEPKLILRDTVKKINK